MSTLAAYLLAFALGAVNLRRVLGAAVLGAVVAGMMAVAAVAASGQCTFADCGTFDCDVTVDGGGLTFGLPDGKTFVFAQIEDGEGLGYLIGADAKPGARPKELGELAPVDGEAGCWESTDRDYKFCVLVEE
jgi:hypothetical protein